MLTYKETLVIIQEIERLIMILQDAQSVEQLEYVKHRERLLRAYKWEHKQAARRENEYALR